MQTLRAIILFITAILGGVLSICSASPRDFQLEEQRLRACVIDKALAETHVRELRNRNDNERIYQYFESLNMQVRGWHWTARMWCGAFVSYVLKGCAVAIPPRVKNPAATVSWLNEPSTWLREGTPQPGDLALYKYSHNRNPVDHIGFVAEWPPNRRYPSFVAIDGNTTAPREANDHRQGVWQKTRRKREVKQLLNVISYHLKHKQHG